MTHLDPERIDQLIDGLLSREDHARIREHLSRGCPTCLAALEGGPDLDLLARMLEAEAASPVAVPASVWKGVASKLGNRPRATPARKPSRRWWPVVALAAAVLLAVPLAWHPHPSGSPGGAEKGAVTAASLHLKVIEAKPGEAALTPSRRVLDGDHLDPASTLIFELETDQPAARYLFVLDSAGAVSWLQPTDPFDTPAAEPAGARSLGGSDGYVALDLSDLKGPLTLVAAASRSPVSRNTILEAWRAHTAPPEVAWDTLTVELKGQLGAAGTPQ